MIYVLKRLILIVFQNISILEQTNREKCGKVVENLKLIKQNSMKYIIKLKMSLKIVHITFFKDLTIDVYMSLSLQILRIRKKLL